MIIKLLIICLNYYHEVALANHDKHKRHILLAMLPVAVGLLDAPFYRLKILYHLPRHTKYCSIHLIDGIDLRKR